jgi:hypothetical protein
METVAFQAKKVKSSRPKKLPSFSSRGLGVVVF